MEVGEKMLFIGEYRYNLDDKGRLAIPTEFRQKLGDEIIISRGIEKCLYVYSLDDWNKLVLKISELSFTKKSHREFSRMFLSGAFRKEIDAKGRTNIDNNLLSYAELKKECVIIGVGHRIEIWDKDVWENYYLEHQSILDEISEQIDLDV